MIVKRRERLSVMLAVVSALYGCGARDIPKYPGKGVDAYPLSKQENGLAVAVLPLTDGRECNEYFGRNLPSENILPTYVVVENRSGGASFIVAKEHFVLATRQAENAGKEKNQIASAKPGQITSLVGVGLTILAPAAAIPVLLVGLHQSTNAWGAQHAFVAKELQAHTLAPGESAQGFVYFQLPAEIPPEGLVVGFDALTPRSEAPTHFEFPIQVGRR